MQITQVKWRPGSYHCDVTLTLSRLECEEMPFNQGVPLGIVAALVESAKAALGLKDAEASSSR